jgi:hypothetical protein|tara:strand:- start:812 stop:1747 length:936 start_codon:yes stop_codon:yes gene_type:complete
MANPKLTVEVEDKDVDIHEADVINENEESEEVEFEVAKDSVKEVEEPEPQAKQESEDELEEYSEGVKKRISQLTYKMREAERQREEAVKYAENILSENKNLKSSLKNSDATLVNEAESRVQSQLDQAKKQYKLAYENGDADAMASANESIARLGAEAENLTRVKKRLDSEETVEQEVDVQQHIQQQQPQQATMPDPKAQDWADKNKWFGQDQVMTFAAFGVHRELADLGYDLQSDDYYEEIDKRMRKEFPHKFTSDSSDANVNVQPKVAAPTRKASNKTGRRVRLSPSQVAIAKRLGVPLEEYAKHVKEGV